MLAFSVGHLDVVPPLAGLPARGKDEFEGTALIEEARDDLGASMFLWARSLRQLGGADASMMDGHAVQESQAGPKIVVESGREPKGTWVAITQGLRTDSKHNQPGGTIRADLKLHQVGEPNGDLLRYVQVDSRFLTVYRRTCNPRWLPARLAHAGTSRCVRSTGAAGCERVWNGSSVFSEEMMRRKIAQGPEGSYEAEYCADHDGVELDKRRFVKMTTNTRDDSIPVDPGGSSETTRGLVSYLLIAAKAGTVIDLFFKALSQGSPEAIPAGPTQVFGPHRYRMDTRVGWPFIHVEPFCGAYGGRPRQHGVGSSISIGDGDRHNWPVDGQSDVVAVRPRTICAARRKHMSRQVPRSLRCGRRPPGACRGERDADGGQR